MRHIRRPQFTALGAVGVTRVVGVGVAPVVEQVGPLRIWIGATPVDAAVRTPNELDVLQYAPCGWRRKTNDSPRQRNRRAGQSQQPDRRKDTGRQGAKSSNPHARLLQLR